jgi:nitrate reductase NapE component
MDYTVNPMMVERVSVLVPLATVIDEPVRREVRGEEVVDPKFATQDNTDTENNNIWVKMKFWAEISFILMLGLAFIGAFILFLVWMTDPTLFGPEAY